MLTAHYANPDVTLPAVNRAEVFRLLPKPWDAEELKAAVREAAAAACGTESKSRK
jgi:hypothetical protein